MVSTMPSADHVGDRSDTWQQQWPPGACDTARTLHEQLSIGERDWHALKAQRARRGAEQLAAALVQLLSADQPAGPSSGAARQRALELLEHAQRWLRAEISDPGCGHGRRG